MSHIFISYSKQDIEFVRYLRTLLQQQGFRVWVDEARINAGVQWWKEIERNIDSCVALVVVMSPHSAESDWVEREILRAEHQHKPVFPILLTGEPWSRLANIQYEDMRAGLRGRLSEHFNHSLRSAIPRTQQKAIQFEIVRGDVTDFKADVLCLKFTQQFYGADEKVADLLNQHDGVEFDAMSPKNHEHSLIENNESILASKVLFIGMPILRYFGYKLVREFGERALSVLAVDAPDTQHIAMTIHGTGRGLDEKEGTLSQFAGIMDAIEAGLFPQLLERITIVERSEKRVERLRELMDSHLENRPYARRVEGEDWSYWLSAVNQGDGELSPSAIEDAGSQPKTHAYVVMPNSDAMDDLYYYGIQGAVHATGLLCERIKLDGLAPDDIDQIKQRIDTAAILIAEVSDPSPDSYLQLGYAWGRNCPTILLTQDGAQSPFLDYPCIVYSKIKDLETSLLDALKMVSL